MSILDRLVEYGKKDIYPFHMPGHKRRMYPNEALESFYSMDITEIDDWDNLHDAKDILKDAQERAAKLFDSYETHFLVNGTTAGILAAIVGSVRCGDTIIMARNCHKCVYNGAMLSGARIEYIYPEQELYLELNAGISAKQVEEALIEATQNMSFTNTRGNILVVITSPTYEGIVSDVEEIANVCHRYGATLLVDAAHGAHFGFSEGFPRSAVKCGADIVVTSIHKTLPAPTQTSLIHIAEGVKAADRIRRMLTVFQTSSPSYPLMAGIDACMELLENEKDTLFKEYEERLNDFYDKARGLKCIHVLSKERLIREGSFDYDFGKIIIYDRSCTLTGKELYNRLRGRYNIQPEMAAGSYVVLMTSVADDAAGYARLIAALSRLDEELSGDEPVSAGSRKRSIVHRLYDHFVGKKIKRVLFENAGLEGVSGLDIINDYDDFSNIVSRENIKDALWQETESLPVELSEGRIAADYVMFYPPGIPIVVPGEVLSGKTIDMILEGRRCGLTINGLDNDGEIKVLWEKSST